MTLLQVRIAFFELNLGFLVNKRYACVIWNYNILSLCSRTQAITYYEIKILPGCNPGYQSQKILKLGNPRKEIRDYC